MIYYSSLSAVKDIKVLPEKERSEGISSSSRDNDSTLLNPGTHSSILDETKSESGIPEVSNVLSYQIIFLNYINSVFSHSSFRGITVTVTFLFLLFVHRGRVNPLLFVSAMGRAA